MNLNNQNSFWGSLSPFGGITGLGILVMSSARLSWAIIAAGSLLFVYGMTVFSFYFLFKTQAKKIFPKQGKTIIFTCFSSFWGCIYLFLIWVFSPFAQT